MPVHNEDIAKAFEEIADLLEIEEANPFRVRAYRNGARAVRGLGQELGTLIAAGEDLSKLPGIGKALSEKIHEYLQTGRLKALERLHREVPESLEEVLKLPGLGPRRVKMLYHKLGVQNLRELETAVKSGMVGELPGFGKITEQNILTAIAAHRDKEVRYLRPVAESYADSLVDYLQQVPGVKTVVVAGSYRRGRETVGDLDILVSTARNSPVMQRFTDYDEVAEVVSQGDTRATVLLRSGLQVDLRVVPQKSEGAALHYFTGSKAHNIQIRRLAQKQGLKINEYGVFKGERQVAGKTETSVFKSVGLAYIPPELREGEGELDAASAGQLPRLIELKDLRGDLHCHTKASDGQADIRAMAEAAKALGHDYLAITDHSRYLGVTRGLDASRLQRQWEEIDRLNEELSGITLLKGIEVDILEDGSLALPNEVLRELDLVVGAVHSQFGLSRRRQTERLLRAMDNPCFSLLAHPTGRLLQEREAYDIDIIRIIRQAMDRGCFLELNSQPRRLDLDDHHCRIAREAGVLVSIDSDAHNTANLELLRHGVIQARRGWLEKQDVLNTRPLRELRRLLAGTFV